MSLTRIQKTFVRLVTSNWMSMPNGGYRRRRIRKYQPSQSKVNVTVIDAVTGQKTTAKAFEESKAKLRKWLKLRNVRAEFKDVLLKRKSAWFKLADHEFIDYPIIVQVGTYKAPYLIKRVQDRVTFKGKTTISIQLETIGNVDYLSILSVKKELLEKKKGSK